MKHTSSRAGFTLMELVVVVLILAVLAGALVPRVTDRLAAARDARRLQDVLAVRDAVEQYYLDNGAYPVIGGDGGWNRTDEDTFLPVLVEEGYLGDLPRDPINDSTYHYRYYVYNKGSSGCVGPGKFYVLGVRTFETTDFQTKNPGYFKCSSRDWSTEFAWVTGGGASEK